jgi:hypothetical protein
VHVLINFNKFQLLAKKLSRATTNHSYTKKYILKNFIKHKKKTQYFHDFNDALIAIHIKLPEGTYTRPNSLGLDKKY